jgi:hypothetical protein
MGRDRFFERTANLKTDRVILILQPTGIDAPKRAKVDHIGFTKERTAAALPNFRLRFTWGERACNKPALFCVFSCAAEKLCPWTTRCTISCRLTMAGLMRPAIWC